MADKFEVIIVGAGLAGLTAAWTLADRGVETLVLERGDYPGAKNVSGGRLYLQPVRGLIPELWEGAPFERHIAHEGFSLMAPERSVSVAYTGDELRCESRRSYTILRSKFDRWLADRAEEKGAMLLTKVRVDDIVRRDGRVAGVMAGGDELRADVVVAADGALSLIAEKAGLRPRRNPESYAVGVKEVISLDPATVNERFHLTDDEGAAHLFLGDITLGKFGGGFLYTNRDSISLGLVIGIHDFMGKEAAAAEVPSLLDRFKARPEIEPLIRGGVPAEYSAHIIPEGGWDGLSTLHGDGILAAGDAAGFALNLGFTVRGMEYAIASGYYAAQAVLQAKDAGDFSAASLSRYRTLLENSFVLKDFQTFRENPRVLSNPRLFAHYPELIGGIFRDIYDIPAGPKEKIFTSLKKRLNWPEIWALLKDAKGMTRI